MLRVKSQRPPGSAFQTRHGHGSIFTVRYPVLSGIEIASPSVCLSICLSACNALELRVNRYFAESIYSIPHRAEIWLDGDKNSTKIFATELVCRKGVWKMRFSTNISIYLGENNTIYDHNCNRIRIGIRMRSIEWCHFQWFWTAP